MPMPAAMTTATPISGGGCFSEAAPDKMRTVVDDAGETSGEISFASRGR